MVTTLLAAAAVMMIFGLLFLMTHEYSHAAADYALGACLIGFANLIKNDS